MSQSAVSGAHWARGRTFYDGLSIDSTNLGGVDQEGYEREFEDVNPTTGAIRTPNRVRCRLMRNISGIAALPKRAVSHHAGANWGKRFDGYTDVLADKLFAGVVDEHLPSAGCPVNDICWVVVYGPTLVLTDLASLTSAINIGDAICAGTAATSEATTAGRVVPVTMTQGGTTGQTALDMAINYIGRALSARTTDNTNADLLCFVGRY